MSITKLHTAADLWVMGSEAPFELIEGELREVSPSEGPSSEIALNFVEVLRPYLRAHRLGRLSSEATGYVVARDPDTVLAPDVGFVRLELVADGFPHGTFVPFPPDLAIEVMSPSNRLIEMERKAALYLRGGTRLVWVVRPQTRTVTVYSPMSVKVLEIDDTLSGGDVLPGFSMQVADVFRDPLER
jgi:Uma2 family endonuclease